MKLCSNITTYVTTRCATQNYKMCYTKLQMKLGTHTLQTKYVCRVMYNIMEKMHTRTKELVNMLIVVMP